MVFEIVRSGTLEEIKSSLTEKKDGDGNSLLMIACSNDRGKDIISYLISSGFAVDARNYFGVSPLMFACAYSSDADVVNLLLKQGAKINSTDDNGQTPLMYAATNGNMDIFRMLVKLQADVRAKDENRMSVLAYACTNPSVTADAVATLLKAGLDVNEASSDGQTPFMKAAAAVPSVEILDMLVKAGCSPARQTRTPAL